MTQSAMRGVAPPAIWMPPALLMGPAPLVIVKPRSSVAPSSPEAMRTTVPEALPSIVVTAAPPDDRTMIDLPRKSIFSM